MAEGGVAAVGTRPRYELHQTNVLNEQVEQKSELEIRGAGTNCGGTPIDDDVKLASNNLIR
jgi:hypothetical protein